MNLFEYILKSMPKVNWNVAKNWLDGLTDEDFHKLYEYVETTPGNTNPRIVQQILNEGDTPSEDESEVGTAKVGTAKVAPEEEKTE